MKDSHYYTPVPPSWEFAEYMTRQDEARNLITVTLHQRQADLNQRQLEYFFNNLFRLSTKKTTKLHIGERDSPHKGPVMLTAFPHHGVIMPNGFSSRYDPFGH